MSWACGKCDREKRKIKGDIIPEHFRTCPKRKSMTTNETLIEKAKSIWDMVDDGGSVEDIAEFLQAKQDEMVQEIEKWMNDEIIDGYGRALVIDVEQWKKLKSKLSNLSK